MSGWKIAFIIIGSFAALILAFLALGAYANGLTDKKYKDAFKNYKEDCDEVSEYFLDISDSECLYYLHRDEEFNLHIELVGIEGSTEIELPKELKKKIDQIRMVFDQVTHAGTPNFIKVTDNYVIFYEDGYYGAMIYTRDSSLEKSVKNKWCEKEYQRLHKLDKHWYSVYVDLI